MLKYRVGSAQMSRPNVPTPQANKEAPNTIAPLYKEHSPKEHSVAHELNRHSTSPTLSSTPDKRQP